MDKKSRDVYNHFDREVRKELKTLEANESIHVDTDLNEVNVANTAILKSKLLQLATGAMYDANATIQNRSYTVFHDCKIDKLKELLKWQHHQY